MTVACSGVAPVTPGSVAMDSIAGVPLDEVPAAAVCVDGRAGRWDCYRGFGGIMPDVPIDARAMIVRAMVVMRVMPPRSTSHLAPSHVPACAGSRSG